MSFCPPRQAAPPTVTALWGGELVHLGDLTSAAHAAGRSALASTRGRFPKGYPYVDPNEDIGLLCGGPGGMLLAVADGHEGIDAARAAMSAVERSAPGLIANALRDPVAVLDELVRGAVDAVHTSLPEPGTRRHFSGTALSLALVTDRRMTAITIGDTTVLRVRGRKAVQVTKATHFLTAHVAPPPSAHSAGLRAGDKVVVASDGLTDFLGRRWKQAIVQTLAAIADPEAAARALVEAACDGGAGDNVTVAVHHAA